MTYTLSIENKSVYENARRRSETSTHFAISVPHVYGTTDGYLNPFLLAKRAVKVAANVW